MIIHHIRTAVILLLYQHTTVALQQLQNPIRNQERSNIYRSATREQAMPLILKLRSITPQSILPMPTVLEQVLPQLQQERMEGYQQSLLPMQDLVIMLHRSLI